MIGSCADFRKRLIGWYRKSRRDLPWRVAPGSPPAARPEPYHVLVSEAMLQQTQVATVIPYFNRFIEAFPTIQDLASAEEQAVLRLWQGLGYYSRARNLRRAAIAVVERFAGVLPPDVERLLTLPGIGRYTAGAVASLAFDRRAPILDGNVARVLCRIDAIESDPRSRETSARLWDRAAELLPQRGAGDFNSALMELGATICTPRTPKCLLCPVARNCSALAIGAVDRIPPARKTKPTPLHRRHVVCVVCAERDGASVLIEQRPSSGRWGGLWQFITQERADADPDWSEIRRLVGPLTNRRRVAQVKHQLTHRRYEFEAWLATVGSRRRVDAPRQWTVVDRLSDHPLSKPQLMIARLLKESLAASE